MSGISDNLELVLAKYTEAKMGHFGSENEVWGIFKELEQAFSGCPPVMRRPTLRVKGSVGQGNWARVPWLTFLDERETQTTQRGVYCVYLFRQDMSGVYITFNQGVTKPTAQHGRTKARQLLRQRAVELRELCGGLKERGFLLDDSIVLQADPGLGSDYESSTIAYKLYEAGNVPEDDVLFEDLESVLGAYDRYLTDLKWREALDLCGAALERREVFDEEEVGYKLRVAGAVREALDPKIDGEELARRLRKAFAHPDNNLTSWQAHDRFAKWASANPEGARRAIRALTADGVPVQDRVDGFLDVVPNDAVSGPGTRVSIASFLLMGEDPENYPFYKPTPFDTVERVLGWSRTLQGESPGAVYAHHLRFARRFLEEVWREGHDVSNLLEAQGLIYFLATASDPAVAIWRGEAPDITEILEAISSWIRNLKTQASPDGRFYYKPLLLLAALDVLDSSPAPTNRLAYDELHDAFMKLAAERGSAVSEAQFSQPYLRTRNDTQPVRVWRIEGKKVAPDDGKADQPAYVRATAPRVMFGPFVWPAFASQEGRERIRRMIHERWPAGGNGTPPSPTRSLSELADELLVDEAYLGKVIDLLRDKGQVIFYGPPGTGKTFVARKLMGYLAAEANRREVVQFHPSYSYEDFVHGYRPVTREDGALSYELKPGPLMRLARQAAQSPGEHVLLIDEINRGNLPKILGELLYLLEYRDDEVALMYGEEEERFSLPEDLLIIGTMNTADRSIALIDAALRRRFHFVPFFPNEPPLQGLLLRWLKCHRPEMIEVAEIVDKLNAGLRERFGPHLQVGPSHFMKKNLDEATLEQVWEYDVMPFLEDQLFGQEEELEKFKLDKLRGQKGADDNVEGAPTDQGTPNEG